MSAYKMRKVVERKMGPMPSRDGVLLILDCGHRKRDYRDWPEVGSKVRCYECGLNLPDNTKTARNDP